MNLGTDLTPEEYLNGLSEESIDEFPKNKRPVKYILDSTISELEEDKLRTFTFSDMHFFKQWFDQQSKSKQLSVKDLILNKQLDLVGGSWAGIQPNNSLAEIR